MTKETEHAFQSWWEPIEKDVYPVHKEYGLTQYGDVINLMRLAFAAGAKWKQEEKP